MHRFGGKLSLCPEDLEASKAKRWRSPTAADNYGLTAAKFVPLEYEVRTHVDTACATYHLGRKPQTLRVWASTEQGPIRPLRINGRLAWPVVEIRYLLSQ